MSACWIQSFKVKLIEGQRGFFPIDMLRYDICHPSQTEDAINIALATRESNFAGTITITRHTSYKNSMPSYDRWNSFGWEVIANSVRTWK